MDYYSINSYNAFLKQIALQNSSVVYILKNLNEERFKF